MTHVVVIGKFRREDLGDVPRRVPAEPPFVELTQRIACLCEAPGKRIGSDQVCTAEPKISSRIDRSLQPMDRLVVVFEHEVGASEHPIENPGGLVMGTSEFDRMMCNRQRLLGASEADQLIGFLRVCGGEVRVGLVARSIASYPS